MQKVHYLWIWKTFSDKEKILLSLSSLSVRDITEKTFYPFEMGDIFAILPLEAV
jgi:hypothetical protein